MVPNIAFSPLTAELRRDYLAFAEEAFGPGSYQANPAYLDWLYQRSPLAMGYEDCRLALRDGIVVGCIHRMRMTWRQGEQSVVLPSVHNTMVRPDCREGAGGLLIAQSFRGEQYAFVPGAEGAVAEMLRRLGFKGQNITWWMLWLRPLAAAGTLVRTRLRLAGSQRTSGLQSSVPVAGEIEELVDLANRGWSSTPDFRPWWNSGLFLWRYFDPYGPQTVLVSLREAGELCGYGLMSFGWRHGLLVARVIDWRANQRDQVVRLFSDIRDQASRIGAHVLLVGSGDTTLTEWFGEAGWKEKRGSAQSFLYGRDRSNYPARVSFMPSVGDYGLEAFGPASP